MKIIISQEKNVDNECCVCKSNNIIDEKYSHCSYHKICKDCFLSVLQMCYCENQLGNPIYKCPICRNEYKFSNEEMSVVLGDLINDNIVCMPVHKKCENKNKTKKCQFENCGCRTNIVDIIIEDMDIDLSIKAIVSAANKYSKNGLNKQESPYIKKRKRFLSN